jgi:hypothetical protein
MRENEVIGAFRSVSFPVKCVVLMFGLVLCSDLTEAAVLNFSLQRISTSTVNDWMQDACDAQRTGYIPIDPLLPWTFRWTFNGPDANGGLGGHFYNGSREGRTVTGDGKIYVPATSFGVYALTLSSGIVAWHFAGSTVNATPAYDPVTRCVYAGGADGVLYKLNAANGTVEGTYNAGSPINRSILIVSPHVFCVSDNGALHKVHTQTMVREWRYDGGGPIATPPAYSAVRDVIVYVTNDLYVHCVNNADGARRWRVKPTPHTAGFPYEFDGMWPVIADGHGVVFVRMRLEHGAQVEELNLRTNAQIRVWLQNNPAKKNLFALDLDTGAEKFIPAVLYGAVEDNIAPDPRTGHQPYGDIGTVPVIKRFPDGTEVAYQPFRSWDVWESGYTTPWNAHLGEMVLDSTTVPGYVAGDLRYVGMERIGESYIAINDELCPITVAGNTVFHAHWGATESIRITDRSASKGDRLANHFSFVRNPTIIRALAQCNDKNLATRWTTCGLTSATDGRWWGGPGWWVYWNVVEPPGPKTSIPQTYSAGLLPRYAYVNGQYIVIQGNGGDIFVMQHSGVVP